MSRISTTRAPPLRLVIAFDIVLYGMLSTTLVFSRLPLLGADNFVLPQVVILAFVGPAAAATLLIGSDKFTVDSLDTFAILSLALFAASSAASVTSGGSAGGLASLATPILLFLTSRSLAIAGLRYSLMLAVSLCIAVTGLTGIFEAYTPFEFSQRVPGGTLGNRNRLAHLVVFGTPTLFFVAFQVRSAVSFAGIAGLCAMNSALILLSRSRAAWLALLVVVATGLIVLVIRIYVSEALCRRTRCRLAVLSLAILGGALLALFLPNRLEWVSPSPYRDSAATLLEYRTGTGAGRMIEYRNTLRMIVHHPWLGVGPGNWRIEYPRYATEEDPNVGDGIVPVRRYPQSEWIGGTAERGIPAMLMMWVFFAAIACRWLRGIVRERSGRRAGYCAVGICTCTAVATVGIFDPVVQTPVAGFIVPVLLGSLATVPVHRPFLSRTRWFGAA